MLSSWRARRLRISQVLQPRRMAARAAARRCAALLGEPVGRRVGYTVRLDSKTSRATRVEFVTTGVLLRRLIQQVRLCWTLTARCRSPVTFRSSKVPPRGTGSQQSVTLL